MQSQRILVALKLCALAAVVVGLVAGIGSRAEPAEGAFPGANGKIAFYSTRDGDAEIYRMNADGSGVEQLTDNSVLDEFPSWSADGAKIAFYSARDGNNEIYEMNAAGTNEAKVKSDPGDDRFPYWSPDGSQIAFESRRDGNWEIYKMNADGSGQTNLTNNSAHDSYPAWSPDGSQIAFESDRDGNFEVYVMSADGSAQARLTSDAVFDGHSDWSPDGSKIAFASNRDGDYEIYVMDANGNNRMQLTFNTVTDYVPAWSPDGSQLCFTSNRDGNDEIYVMNAADGSNQKNRTNDGARDDQCDWQPLGNTPGGTSVCVSLNGGLGKVDGIEVCFSNVTASGVTTVDVTTPCPPGTAPDTGFIIWGLGGQSSCYDINTTASFTGLIRICITYDDTGLTPGRENVLTLKRTNSVPPGPQWTELANITLDKTNNIICGDSETLSFFTIQLPAPVGGVAELPAVAGASLETQGTSRPSASVVAGVAAAVATGAAALGGAAWYVRRRA